MDGAGREKPARLRRTLGSLFAKSLHHHKIQYLPRPRGRSKLTPTSGYCIRNRIQDPEETDRISSIIITGFHPECDSRAFGERNGRLVVSAQEHSRLDRDSDCSWNGLVGIGLKARFGE